MRSSVLLSMTGFGEARHQDQRWSVQVEVRTVNNRHLKLTAKISEPYSALEPDLERLVRETIRRGDGPAQRAGRAAPAGRGLPAQHRGPGAATATSSRPCRAATGRPVDLGGPAGPARRGRGDPAGRDRPARRLARASPGWSPRPSSSSRPPGPRKAGPWPRSCSPWPRRSTSHLDADRRPRPAGGRVVPEAADRAGPGPGRGPGRRRSSPRT